MTAKPGYSSQVAKEKGHYEREFSSESSSLPVQALILSGTPSLRAGTEQYSFPSTGEYTLEPPYPTYKPLTLKSQ